MGSSTYAEVYGRWLADPTGFWAQAAQDVHWTKTWDEVLDDEQRAVLSLVPRWRR